MVLYLNIFVWKWSKIAAQFFVVVFLLILPYKTCWKPCFPIDERPLVERYIANFGISLDNFEFLCFRRFFPFLGILGPPYWGIGATIRIGRELTVFLPPLPEVGCPIFLEIRNPWGKVMERSGLIFKHFCLEVV